MDFAVILFLFLLKKSCNYDKIFTRGERWVIP